MREPAVTRAAHSSRRLHVRWGGWRRGRASHIPRGLLAKIVNCKEQCCASNGPLRFAAETVERKTHAKLGPIPATSAPGLGQSLPHLHRDWANPCHICTGTRPADARKQMRPIALTAAPYCSLSETRARTRRGERPRHRRCARCTPRRASRCMVGPRGGGTCPMAMRRVRQSRAGLAGSSTQLHPPPATRHPPPPAVFRARASVCLSVCACATDERAAPSSQPANLLLAPSPPPLRAVLPTACRTMRPATAGGGLPTCTALGVPAAHGAGMFTVAWCGTSQDSKRFGKPCATTA
jgi:hypothetical protein